MPVVLGQMVGHPRDAGVDVGAAQLLGGHLLAGRRLHERRAAQEDRALALDDDRLVAHRRHVGSAGGARAHHRGDLRHPQRRHARLVVEDAPEVVAVGEHLGLERQERAPRIHQVEARQPVLERDLLGAHVLLDRHREVGAALHGGVVRDHHDRTAVHRAHPGDHSGARRLVVVEPVRGQGRQLEERGAGVEQALDALAHEQLAARAVARDLVRPAALAHLREPGAQLDRQRLVMRGVGLELGAGRVEVGLDAFHAGLL